jgi:hypothetical protein
MLFRTVNYVAFGERFSYLCVTIDLRLFYFLAVLLLL